MGYEAGQGETTDAERGASYSERGLSPLLASGKLQHALPCVEQVLVYRFRPCH
jgi:hypothetical protein